MRAYRVKRGYGFGTETREILEIVSYLLNRTILWGLKMDLRKEQT